MFNHLPLGLLHVHDKNTSIPMNRVQKCTRIYYLELPLFRSYSTFLLMSRRSGYGRTGSNFRSALQSLVGIDEEAFSSDHFSSIRHSPFLYEYETCMYL